jgi:hypothetical protein
MPGALTVELSSGLRVLPPEPTMALVRAAPTARARRARSAAARVWVAHGRAVLVLVAIAALVLPTPTAAFALATASMSVSLQPNRPRALAVLRLHVRYEDPQSDVPPPLRRAVLRLPQALGVEVPQLRSCSAATLRAHGPRGCPPQSRIGSGQALAEARAGSQTLSERVALSAFLGPPIGLGPTFEMFAQGLTPLEQRLVLSGTVVPDSPPYGEDLDLSIPPIATLTLEPDASIVALSLSIGSRVGGHRPRPNAVVVPALCPRGGLPFAVQSSFADGSSSTATASIPCPAREKG